MISILVPPEMPRRHNTNALAPSPLSPLPGPFALPRHASEFFGALGGVFFLIHHDGREIDLRQAGHAAMIFPLR